MRVTINYDDSDSLTVEEIVARANHTFGKTAEVVVMPDSHKAHDLIYFALQKIMTHDQLSMFYDDKHSYQKNIQKLRNETLFKVSEIIDQVIIDNEAKVT